MPRRLPDTVLLLHNQPPANASGAESIAGVLDQVHAVENALVTLGVTVERIGVCSLTEAGRAITRSTAPVVFNLVEAFVDQLGDAELIPALCRSFGKAVTGNDTPALLLTLDKWKSKSMLKAAGVPTPEGVLVRVGDEIQKNGEESPSPGTDGGAGDSSPVPANLPPAPWIVKPVSSDASEGITCDSMIRSPNVVALRKQIARIHKDFHQPALVESCVGEREINVSLLQTGKDLKVLPLAEIDFSRLKANEPKIVDYDAKWKISSHRYKATRRVVPAKLPKAIAERIRSTALAAWKAVGCRHYARVDLRLDGSGALHVLEVNANPDISPDAGFVAALEAGGISFKEFVGSLVGDAYEETRALRRALETKRSVRRSGSKTATTRRGSKEKATIRRSRVSDRQGIVKLLDQPRYFKSFEVVVALEVLDDAHKGGPDGHYQSFVALHRGRLVGWICYGHAPCTEGTYDVYWIAVAPAMQGKGIGGDMIRYVEARMLKLGGRMNLLDTAGRPDYEPTRKFYLSMGYDEISRVPDFYSPGDDKVTFGKRLA